MSAFDDMLSFSDAARIWDVNPSTLRKAVIADKLVEGEDCKKFGKQWVVLVSAMAREFRGGYASWTRHKVALRVAEEARQSY